MAPRWDNPNPGGDTKKLSCEYYSQLTLKQIDGLIAKYKKDLTLYEYDAEDHRKCAKDYEESEVKLGSDRKELNENGVALDHLVTETVQNENEGVLEVLDATTTAKTDTSTKQEGKYIKMLT